jgi:FlaA1/EpsC-like NDP-sugar epimerase
MLSFLVTSDMQFRRAWMVEQYPVALLFFLIIKLLIFGFFKQYRGWWRYVGISDLTDIFGASLLSSLIIVLLWYFVALDISSVRDAFPNLSWVKQGVFIIDPIITVLLLAGLRMIVRLYYEEFRTVESGRLKRFLIIGAGNAGEALLRDRF